jgi:GAF domain-containing protein
MLRSRADAGTLFVRTGNSLRFEIAKNNTLQSRKPSDPILTLFTKTPLPISQQSIAGYVAATGHSLNISDAYHIPENVPYHFNSDFDHRTGYHSQSMLVVPLTDANNKVLGVLQLINRTDDDGQIVPFPPDEESIIHAMAQQAAIALRYRAPR